MGTRPGTGDGHPSRSARLWRCVSEEHPRPRRRRDAPMRIALGTNVACFSIFIRFPLSDSSCRPGESECRSSAPENLVDCGVSRSQGLRAAGCLKLPQEHHVCVLQVTTGERRPEIKRRLDTSLRLSLRAATLCTLEGSALGSATCRQHAGEAGGVRVEIGARRQRGRVEHSRHLSASRWSRRWRWMGGCRWFKNS